MRGAPVVCADAMSLPEVAGDAALLVDPGDQAAIDAAVARVVGDPELRARAGAPRPRAGRAVHLGAHGARDARVLPARARALACAAPCPAS